jgi:antirestriction protein
MTTMTREISNYDDVIDSRDVIERIAELQLMAEDGDALLDQDERIELATLVELAREGEQAAADWFHGEALVRDSYFVTYAEQLADELSLIPRDAGWPATCIDWEQAARELQMDYTPVEFDGVTYWVR